VEVHVRVGLQPGHHVWRGVGGQVVEHDVDVGVGVRRDRPFEEGQEVRAVTGGFALAIHLAGAHVQGGEQVRRAMPDVVVGAFLGRVERDRQQRLGPVQRLDLGLLVDRKDHGATGRVEIEPDDVATFSANAGSLLTLNVPDWSGLIRVSRHSFAT
jgi:hypothetical protein